MGRVPCTGTYTPGGGGTTPPPGSGTIVTCPSTSVPEVTTYAKQVASFSGPRSEGILLFNKYYAAENPATTPQLWLFAGYDDASNWLGDFMEVYDASTGAVSQVTFSQPLPQPAVVLQPGWGKYPLYEGVFIFSGAIFYTPYKPITDAYYIEANGTVTPMSTLYPNWGSPPITFNYAIIFSAPSAGLFVLPDDNGGANQDALFFNTTDGTWTVLPFNSAASDGPVSLFNTNTRYMGTSPASGINMVYDEGISKVLDYFLTYDFAGNPTGFGYTYAFNGEDPYAILDSTGNSYNLNVSANLLLNASDNATYDSAGNLTGDGRAAIMHGGFRLDASFNIIEDIWLQEYHSITDFNLGTTATGTSKMTDICTRGGAASTLATSYQEEEARGSNLYVPDSVDTTTRPETIYVQYFMGGIDPETSTYYDGSLWAIVTVLRTINDTPPV